ncbi:MAG: NMD3-related protein [Candidatus Nezhaarchaeota archaeon]|nr:NMD3-related protein [Candidatus Nezhaarchaeota archaeon]
MKLKRFCAKCGVEVTLEESLNFKNLCLNCYKELHGKVALPPVNVVLCRKCFSVKVRGRWQPLDLSSEELAASTIAQLIEGEVKRTCGLEVKVYLTPQEVYKLFSGERIGVNATVNEALHPRAASSLPPLDVRGTFSVCHTCLRVAGKNFEATLQLRDFAPRELDQIKFIVNKLVVERSGGSHNLQTGVTWEEVDGGVDIKVPSIYMARAIASHIKRRFAVLVRESYKDAGWSRSRGKPFRKLTILLRLRNT